MAKRKPLVIVTRKLPDVVETRMRELFNARLNSDDHPYSRPELIAAVKEAEVLVPTVTDRIDKAVIMQAGSQLKLSIVGARLSFQLNGTEEISATDSTITGGAPGIMTYGAATGDNWGGGAATTPTPSTYSIGGTENFPAASANALPLVARC